MSAGTLRVIDVIDAITGSRTKGCSEITSPVAWKRVNFYVDVEAITRTTGSVAIQLRWKSISGAVLNVTTDITDLVGIGITEFTIDPQFANGTTDAIPEPSESVVVFTGDTSLFTARVYMFAAD